MAHPECETPEHRSLIDKLPEPSEFQANLDSKYIDRVVSGGKFEFIITEEVFLEFAASTDKDKDFQQLHRPRSYQYTMWDYLLDNRGIRQAYGVEFRKNRQKMVGFPAFTLLDLLKNQDLRLGRGPDHQANLEKLVEYFAEIAQ